MRKKQLVIITLQWWWWWWWWFACHPAAGLYDNEWPRATGLQRGHAPHSGQLTSVQMRCKGSATDAPALPLSLPEAAKRQISKKYFRSEKMLAPFEGPLMPTRHSAPQPAGKLQSQDLL